MRSLTTFALIGLSFASLASATSATAAPGDIATQSQVERAVELTHEVCSTMPAERICAEYQTTLLSLVADDALRSSAPVSAEEISQRQMEALIASVS